MAELGELERRHDDFARRGLRVIVVSNDDQKTARETKADYPHLMVVSDAKQNLAKAIQVIHAGMGPGGGDTNVPTTFLVDRTGTVRWFFRPDRFISRLSPDELLAAVDENRPRG